MTNQTVRIIELEGQIETTRRILKLAMDFTTIPSCKMRKQAGEDFCNNICPFGKQSPLCGLKIVIMNCETALDKTKPHQVDLSLVVTSDLVNELVKRKEVTEHPTIRNEKHTAVTFTKETWDRARILVVKNPQTN